MSRYEMRMSVRHDCPFCDISSRYPDATFRVWDNFRTIIVEVNGLGAKEMKLLRTEPIFSWDSNMIQEGEGSIRIFVNDSRLAGTTISQMIKDNDCWYLVPDEIRGGWEHHTIFSNSRESLQKLVKDIESAGGEAKVSSIHPMSAKGKWEQILPVSSLLAGLTEKQINAISAAVEMGYFEEPSKISAEDLSKMMGVSRSTFSEHLRKAQMKILNNLFSWVRIGSDGPTLRP
jgi:predicted DNA binding protein